MERPLLYLHGFSGGIWESGALQKIWSRPVAGVEMPGHSGSEMPEDCRFEVAVERVVSAARDCACPVDLVGYSMGARVGLGATLSHPECFNRVALVGARPGLRTEVERKARRALDEERAQKLETLGILAFMEWWESLPVIASQKSIAPGFRLQMQEARREHSVIGLAASLREMGSGAMPSLWPLLGTLRVPCLLVTGQHDTGFSEIAAEMAKHHASFEHQMIPSAGHCPHWERPDLVQKLLSDFFAA